MDLFTVGFLTSLLLGAVTAGVPLLLAGLGEQLSEKAGVLNIGLEGMMLSGGYLGFYVAWQSQSMGLGLLAGGLAGALTGGLMALLCVWWRLNQIVVGIAITLGAEGATALLHYFQFSRTYPRLGNIESWAIPGLSNIPVLGQALFNQPLIIYLAVLAVPLFAMIYRGTLAGLYLQAAGDKPAALDAAGVNVLRTRTLAVLITGLFAGLGGAFMSQVGAGIFVPFMTQGNGFIGIVLAMLARGKPLWVLAGALLFGCCLSMTTALQVLGVDVPTDVIQMLPFITVMLVLLLFGRRASLPAALGAPYIRGAR
ncbi:simple sugar transport system permease protein [Erwinia toletana]|uniref:Simple sugar transport system permease protein n=1 Tax=Winslowiella toletana TaxID=92490 RepID=A0ABS4PD25_9GAMM|nr:ABC transporter permease [Winslowiella toletana]MBP2170020.1 simple sugar transport system permease protein [Winslowiella toletana]